MAQAQGAAAAAAGAGRGAGWGAALLWALLCWPYRASGTPEMPDTQELPPIAITAPEPRYVAPTQYDRIGRIWVPAMINDRGPFRLVLDTGATQSAVNAGVALALGITPSGADTVLLSGATGSRAVATIAVQSLSVGDVELRDQRLPVLADALGGADGIMGTEGFLDKRIRIDFAHDRITVQRSHDEPPPPGFVTVKVAVRGGLLVVERAHVGDVPARVIIDTGGQGTVVNEALRRALRRHRRPEDADASEITGATLDVQRGDRMMLPEMLLGELQISPAEVTVGDLYIFERWRMTEVPTVILGMDVLGLLDTLIIDYPRQELQIRTH